MPLTLVGMARVFLDDLDRRPPGVSRHHHNHHHHHHHQDDIQDIDTVTSAVSEYALSDDGIDEADFALDEEPMVEEEESSSLASLTASGEINMAAEESRTHELEQDETCHDHPLDGLRTPAPANDRHDFYLPSILVTEIDDFKSPRNTKSDTRDSSSCNLFEPYSTKARTRTA